jgi:hypothetical protein
MYRTLRSFKLAVLLRHGQENLAHSRRAACFHAWNEAAQRCRRCKRIANGCQRQRSQRLLATCFGGWLRVVVAQQGHAQLQRAGQLEKQLQQSAADLQAEQLQQAAAADRVDALEQQCAQLEQEVTRAVTGAAAGGHITVALPCC